MRGHAIVPEGCDTESSVEWRQRLLTPLFSPRLLLLRNPDAQGSVWATPGVEDAEPGFETGGATESGEAVHEDEGVGHGETRGEWGERCSRTLTRVEGGGERVHARRNADAIPLQGCFSWATRHC